MASNQPSTPEGRARILKEAETGLHLSEASLHQLVDIRRWAQSAGLLDDVQVLGAMEFTYFLHFDLVCLLAEMVRHGPTLRANLYARLIILTVYEASKEMRSLLAKDLREQITGATGSTVIGEALKATHSSAVGLFERCNVKFGAVRHGVAGHRNADAEERIKLVQRADVEEVAQLTLEMLKIITQLLQHFDSYLRDLFARVPGVLAGAPRHCQ